MEIYKLSAGRHHPFGMPMPERSLSISDYRFGFNTQEKVDEISGNGNHNTAKFWEYDTRLGRRWNVDPLGKPWESGYASLGNNPIMYNDILGLEVKNAHKPAKEKAESLFKNAKAKLDGLQKGDDGYKEAKKEAMQAEKEFNKINQKFQRVESKIRDIKATDPDLFKEADRLTDPGGTQIDIYVYDTPDDEMQEGISSDKIKYGDTRAYPGTDMKSSDGSIPDYTSVRTTKPGDESKHGDNKYTDNTIVIRISDVAKTVHLAHEFGHAVYQGKSMKEYKEWLQKNPKEQNKGGHGKGDPSGEAAKAAEAKFN